MQVRPSAGRRHLERAGRWRCGAVGAVVAPAAIESETTPRSGIGITRTVVAAGAKDGCARGAVVRRRAVSSPRRCRCRSLRPRWRRSLRLCRRWRRCRKSAGAEAVVVCVSWCCARACAAAVIARAGGDVELGVVYVSQCAWALCTKRSREARAHENVGHVGRREHVREGGGVAPAPAAVHTVLHDEVNAVE